MSASHSTLALLTAALDARKEREGINPCYVNVEGGRMTLDVAGFMATDKGQEALRALQEDSSHFDRGQPIARLERTNRSL